MTNQRTVTLAELHSDTTVHKLPHLYKTAHLTQLIGKADGQGNYYIEPNTISALKNLQKVVIINEDSTYGSFGTIDLQTVQKFNGKPLNFIIEAIDISVEGEVLQKRAVLYLREEADEIGGMVVCSYLTPVAIFDSTETENFLDMAFAEFGAYAPVRNETEIALLDGLCKRRAARRQRINEEQERLNRAALTRTLKRATQAQSNNAIKDFDKMKKDARFFTRLGKSDYYQAQFEMLKLAARKNELPSDSQLAQDIHKAEAKTEKQATRALKEYITENAPAAEPLQSGTTIPANATKDDIIDIKRRAVLNKQRRERAQYASIQKLPVAVRSQIKDAKLNFNSLLAKVKSSKTAKPNARAEFNKTYIKKAAAVMNLFDAEEELAEESELEIIESQILIPQQIETAQTLPTPESTNDIAAIIAGALENYHYREDERKAELVGTVKSNLKPGEEKNEPQVTR